MAYRRIFLLFIAALCAGGAGAAELGEPRVSSYRGQALAADIELTSLDDPAAAVQVRVASPDVYRGASITVPPVLSALTLSVVKKDGRQFVHVASNRPVDTEMLLLFLELGQGGQKDVRLATLFLTADPRPAPPPPVAVVVPPPVAAPAPVSVPVPAPVPARAPVVAPAPLPLHLAPVSTVLPASLRPSGICKPSSSNSACAILDKKNVALQAKLAGLEDKIRQLQATMVVPEAVHAAAPAPIVPPIAAIKPPPAPVAVLVTPKKPRPAVHPPSATPWLWIAVAAAVALAAIGAIVFLLLRRRRGRAEPAAPGGPKPPGFMDGVRNRLMPGKAPKAEPVLEEA